MILSRRSVLRIGGGFLAALPFGAAARLGRRAGGHHHERKCRWLEGLVRAGRPAHQARPDRPVDEQGCRAMPIPRPPTIRITTVIRCAFLRGAEPWNSDYLLPDEVLLGRSDCRPASTIISASRMSMPGWSGGSSWPTDLSRCPRRPPAAYRKSPRRRSRALKILSEAGRVCSDDQAGRLAECGESWAAIIATG